MLRGIVQHLIAIGLVVVPAAPIDAQAPSDVPTTTVEVLGAELQLHLDSLNDAASFPGVSVALVMGDGTTLALTAGVADSVGAVPMRPSHRLLAGSVGKTYVSAVALQLVDEGVLALDAPISTYLGSESWFARLPNAADITVRMLMNHTSGLVRYEFHPEVARLIVAEPDRVWTPEERIGFILDAPPPFAAGEGWEYSDTNYIVLGMILERIAGASLDDLIVRRLLQPLGLIETMPSNRRELPGVPQGYAGTENPFGGIPRMIENGRFYMNPQMEWAGGGYAMTTGDLARWTMALYRGLVLPEGVMREMLHGVPAPMLGRGAQYGLGVIILDTDLGPSWGHSGFFPGYLTETRYYPALRLAIAIQYNTSVGGSLGRNPGAVLHDLARKVAAHQAPGI